MAKIPTRIAFGNVGQTSSSNRKSASAIIGVEWATDAFAVGAMDGCGFPLERLSFG